MPQQTTSFDTHHAAALLVLLALAVLFGLRRFFGSVNVGVGR